MTDKNSYMFIIGSDLVKTVTYEEVSKEELEWAYIHSIKSGVTHFIYDSEEEVLVSIHELLSFFPSNNQEIIPVNPNMPYDMKDIIGPVLNGHYFFESMSHFTKNTITGFGRLNGKVVGIVANQPIFSAGLLDINSFDKISRFIRFHNCFNILIVTFEDILGFLPGTMQEYNGIIHYSAKIVYVYSKATILKIALITCKAYGNAYIVMSSKENKSDINLAYLTAKIDVMRVKKAIKSYIAKLMKKLREKQLTNI